MGDVAVEVLGGREAPAPAVDAEQGAGVRGGGRARALADCAALINHGRQAHHALGSTRATYWGRPRP